MLSIGECAAADGSFLERDLAREIGKSRPFASVVIKKLRKEGLVVGKTYGPFRISEEGLGLLRDLQKAKRRLLRLFAPLRGFSKEEKESLALYALVSGRFPAAESLLAP
jgi:Mn-dependent DtxR family transcriptional regulator